MDEHEQDFDAELDELLGENVHPATKAARKLSAAIWEFFGGAPNRQVGDAKTVAFTLTVEMVDAEGNRWIRHCACDAEGNQLPPWQLKGYLADAQDWARLLYERIAEGIESNGADFDSRELGEE